MSIDVDVQTVISKYIDGEHTDKSGLYVPAEAYDTLLNNYYKVKKAYVELRRKEEAEKEIKEQQRKEAQKIVKKWKEMDGLDLRSMMPIDKDKIEREVREDLRRTNTKKLYTNEIGEQIEVGTPDAFSPAIELIKFSEYKYLEMLYVKLKGLHEEQKKFIKKLMSERNTNEVKIGEYPKHEYCKCGYEEKPPIGVKPCFIHAEERIKDLADGISRYAHKGDYEIIQKWANEINLQCELAKMEKEDKQCRL